MGFSMRFVLMCSAGLDIAGMGAGLWWLCEEDRGLLLVLG